MGWRGLVTRQYRERFSPLARLTRWTVEATQRRVQSGPFCGMAYVDRWVGSVHVPKLLGIYEREITPVLERVFAGDFDLLVDVGAAEGKAPQEEERSREAA